VIVEVDTDSAVPAYEQIRAQVTTMIATGVLPPGHRLPPIRQLAADLGLAVNTVARAYRELELAGAVVSRVRHGTVVAEQPAAAIPQAEARHRVTEAAQLYARTGLQLGVPIEEALDAVRAAWRGLAPR